MRSRRSTAKRRKNARRNRAAKARRAALRAKMKQLKQSAQVS